MFGVKILLYTLEALLVVCALVLLWYDNPECGVFVAKGLASLFILIAILASRETVRL